MRDPIEFSAVHGHEAAPPVWWRLNRRRVYELLEAGRSIDRASIGVDAVLVALIFVSLVATTLESVPALAARWQRPLFWVEAVSIAVFSLEYVLRVMCAVERPEARFQHPVWGRLRYALSPLSLADLLAVLPFYLSAFVSYDLRTLRILRLFRILKLTHYFTALDTLVDVLRMERHALGASYFLVALGIVMASAGVYAFEHKAQPDLFASVPAAIYWSIVTLTTVGYGDVVPITAGGQVMSAFVIMLGVGTMTIPTTIVATGFVLEMRKRRARASHAASGGRCFECGGPRRDPDSSS